jgi:DNA-3-methyladenine glycosylase
MRELSARNMGKKLGKSFYGLPALKLARALIGLTLVRSWRGRQLKGRITETEAYLGPRDLASHASRGRTARTEVMFGPPGHAYVYLIYGRWHCLNVVAGPRGRPHAVLIRSVVPLSGFRKNAQGPGLVCERMKIDKKLNGENLAGEKLWIERPEGFRPPSLRKRARVGVDYAGAWAAKLWRFSPQ